MTVEKFVISDVVKLDDGKTLEFIYSDTFDPEKIIAIVTNPDTPSEERAKYSNRLVQAKYITSEALNKLLPKPTT